MFIRVCYDPHSAILCFKYFYSLNQNANLAVQYYNIKAKDEVDFLLFFFSVRNVL